MIFRTDRDNRLQIVNLDAMPFYKKAAVPDGELGIMNINPTRPSI